LSFEPEALFEEFLTALSDPTAGARLYRMHSPDAILRSSEGIRRGVEVDPTEFASAHGEIVREGLHALPRFVHPTLVRAIRRTSGRFGYA
jgi:hypothetical protein